jgi:hypothetical protein
LYLLGISSKSNGKNFQLKLVINNNRREISPNPAPEKKDQKEVTVRIHKGYRMILTTLSHSDADPDL